MFETVNGRWNRTNLGFLSGGISSHTLSQGNGFYESFWIWGTAPQNHMVYHTVRVKVVTLRNIRISSIFRHNHILIVYITYISMQYTVISEWIKNSHYSQLQYAGIQSIWRHGLGPLWRWLGRTCTPAPWGPNDPTNVWRKKKGDIWGYCG